MSSHPSSDASTPPCRIKSTSSIRPRRLKHAKSFNSSELAHQEALVAAELAFERGRERAAASTSLTNISDMPDDSSRSEGFCLGSKKSVRFTGSNAVKTRELPNTRRQVSELHDVIATRSTVSRQLQLQQSEEPLGSALELAPPEFSQSNPASEPSSYRKLRKAKSMFTPIKPSTIVSAEGTSTDKFHFKRHSMQSSDSHNGLPRLPDRRLRRSFSFLRGMSDRISTTNRQFVANDAAIQIARDQYLRQLEEQRLKEQPSLFGLRKRPQNPKQMRRTVRTSSAINGEYADPPSELLGESGKPRKLEMKVRTVSQTLKKAINRVFGRTIVGEAKLPVQHFRATKPHYGEASSSNVDENQYSLTPSPDVELLRRIDSRETSSCEQPVNVEKDAFVGSVRSLANINDITNLESRVTSWTNSTAASTVSVPQLLERKRLSIIKEDGGPHQPSSSVRPYGNYEAFRQPARIENSGPTTAQRVFSALQKEIRKSDQLIGLESSDSGSDSSSGRPSVSPVHGKLRRASSGSIDAKYTANSQSREMPEHGYAVSVSNPITGFDDIPFRPDQMVHNFPFDKHGNVKPIDDLTPQQIADFNEHTYTPQRRPLREVKSAFFPSESRIERSTTSPYRKVKHENSENTFEPQDHRSILNSEFRVRPSYSLDSLSHGGSAGLSESSYSRTSGGHSTKVARGPTNLVESKANLKHGSAVIITNGFQLPGNAKPAKSQQRQASSNTSGEWKRWLSSEASCFEDPSPVIDGIYNALPVVSEYQGRHRRENAQFDGEDVAIGESFDAAESIKQPLGTLHTSAISRSPLQRMESRVSSGKTTTLDIEAMSKTECSSQNDITLRTRSQATLNRQNTLERERESFRVVSPQKSIQTFHNRIENELSPVSENHRNSLERAERLRRLQSKSSLNLNKASTAPDALSPANRSLAASNLRLSGQFSIGTGFNSAKTTISTPDVEIVGSKAMVGGFLKSRRSRMRMSEESGSDLAFL